MKKQTKKPQATKLMRQKADKNTWLNCYIVWIVHPTICSSRESEDIPTGNKAKQNNTELRRGDVWKGVWLLSADEVAPFF